MRRFLKFYSFLILFSFPLMAEEVFFAPNMPDVPVMEKMTIVDGSDFSFSSDNGMVSEVVYQTNHSEKKIRDFYEETLPSLGWEKVSENSYQRSQDILSIRIEKKSEVGGSVIFIEFQSRFL